MDFSHYLDAPVALATALVNTKQLDGDTITSTDDLKAFLDDYSDMWKGVARPPVVRNLARVRGLRDSLREVIASPDDATAAERVNAILSEHGAEPRVSVHSGTPHLHFEPVGSSMLQWLGATTAMGLASVIVDHGVDRFGVCNSTTCNDVYVDTSRNRSRLHCSSTCSTREAVAAYRKRQAGS